MAVRQFYVALLFMTILIRSCNTQCHKMGSWPCGGNAGLPLSHSEAQGLFSLLPCLSVSDLTPSASSLTNEVDFKRIVMLVQETEAQVCPRTQNLV